MPIANLLSVGKNVYCFLRIEVVAITTKSAIGIRHSEMLLTSYQTSGSAQRSAGEPRQAGNGATVAKRACVAGKSGVWPILKK